MNWLLIAALWTANPPKDDFKFYTEVFASKQDCELAAQALYKAAHDTGVQARVTCASKESLGFPPVYY